ncbi:PREDICTED: maf-like protein Cbei_0489 isoform X1 [Polistes dominula]|uniref:Maf-like protein Cbei_0489 isoform X1 n=1 Tax=Polistes dominula TaxID=743375 RepID=A0ABM1IKZ1_POLDO|nr:PREDICTED: maf-like protein Cbei_0489 isoform X1 [Polistes dominula]XP_015180878.1 PREDICTED: maf-like protein Cbei_0489 isoform X1 [Polistes dominula]
MLEPTRQALASTRIILASGSPRRYKIIKKLGLDFEVMVSNYDENLDRSMYKSHGDYVQDLAKLKAYEVHKRLQNSTNLSSLIISADTFVTVGDTIYGKPKDESDAFRMLSHLANREHVVYTGVCLKTPTKEVNFYTSTKVKFGDLSEDQIKAYVKTGECLDKAGGYGVQGLGGCLVESINGDFYTVMGMPIYFVTKHLNEIFANSSVI